MEQGKQYTLANLRVKLQNKTNKTKIFGNKFKFCFNINISKLLNRKVWGKLTIKQSGFPKKHSIQT